MNNNLPNLIAAIILSIAVIAGWHYFVEQPRIEKAAQATRAYHLKMKKLKEKQIRIKESQDAKAQETQAAQEDKGSRIKINSKVISGSISTKGLRFDELTLLRYKENLGDDSKSVKLLSPAEGKQSYFAEIGWWSNKNSQDYPNSSTIWQADREEIVPGQPVKFTWTNSKNVTFTIIVDLDEDYLFTLQQKISNNSSAPISTQFYGIINKNHAPSSKSMGNILHQGMIGAIDGQLQEYTYDKIKDDKKKNFKKGDLEWIGITDKYWLTAFIPDKSEKYSANYNFALKSGQDKYQADYISEAKIIEPGEEMQLTHHMFAGAKKVKLLDKYEAQLGLELFDRAIDFGWFYILTKPIFNLMNFFYKYVGNFGLSIMIVTVIIKVAMFSVANKSYKSMKKMKKLQPQMDRLKELYAEDKPRLNQEVMALYKREKVNPVSGCLPMFVQIPVFFSIYKVLYVTIEMRHAPFFGWIMDLSAPDPTSIFNLFGLLPFTPPGFLMIGAWPIIMATTMFLQQRMSPEPTDPVQAKVMKLMPLMFLFLFSSFPAGLLIYWSWNNVLSIVQQSYINKLSK